MPALFGSLVPGSSRRPSPFRFRRARSGSIKSEACPWPPTVKNSPMEETATRLAQVRERMADAARKGGRTADQIELVAVSKTHAAEKVQAAIEAGPPLFGGSRGQEAGVENPLLPLRFG